MSKELKRKLGSAMIIIGIAIVVLVGGFMIFSADDVTGLMPVILFGPVFFVIGLILYGSATPVE